MEAAEANVPPKTQWKALPNMGKGSREDLNKPTGFGGGNAMAHMTGAAPAKKAEAPKDDGVKGKAVLVDKPAGKKCGTCAKALTGKGIGAGDEVFCIVHFTCSKVRENAKEK